jgi:putative PIN family toxin of toxin-antitoxin system
MVRIVLDTDVIVAATRSDRGAARQFLAAALDRRFELLLSVPLMLEYEAVLTREEHLAASGLSAIAVNQLLDGLATVITPVTLRFLWRPIAKDAGDEMVLETAVNGGADWLVTFNVRHLAVAAEFGIRVMPPRDAWREYMSHEEK